MIVSITEIAEGANRLVGLAESTSESDPPMAIAQLLFAAAALAQVSGVNSKTFLEGARSAWKDVEQKQ